MDPYVNLMDSKDSAIFTNPPIVAHGQQRYRAYPPSGANVSEQPQPLPPYRDNDDMLDVCEYEDDCEITRTIEGKFQTAYYVVPLFIPSVVGLKGTKKSKIELETSTTLKIPRKGETGKVFIEGNSERNVISARNRIHMIVLEMRDKQPATHFISIRLYSDAIAKNFEQFKASILSGPKIRGVDPSIFHKARKFHLTIAPLVLLDNIEETQAAKALEDCKDIVHKTLFEDGVKEKLQLVIEGVEIMNDDPTNVDVLYGKVSVKPEKYNERFQKTADAIADHFAKKGFIRKQYDKVKLHATVINTIFRKPEGGGPTDYKTWKREGFDATPILDKFKDYHFGCAELNSIHLSVRFSTAGDEYYNSAATIPLI